MKVLVVTPSFSLLGGVANHFSGLKAYWSCQVDYVFYGKRKKIPAIIMLPIDLLVFVFQLIINRPDIVVINPSLRSYQIKRDGIYLLTARLFRLKVVCFFHGWDIELASKLEKKPGMFKRIYNQSSQLLVLASDFKKSLLKMGFSCPIDLTTTKVSDHLLGGFNNESRKGECLEEILFLARIVKTKGIFIALEAFQLVQDVVPNMRMRIVGDGPELENVKQFVSEMKIKNVIFTGVIFGDALREHFISTQLSVLPSFGEGMPTSILEAMAFGMPIVTSPVGGTVDFFENEKMGFLVKEMNAEAYAEAMLKIINDPLKFRAISNYNFHYAQEHFLASKVAIELEKQFVKLLPKYM